MNSQAHPEPPSQAGPQQPWAIFEHMARTWAPAAQDLLAGSVVAPQHAVPPVEMDPVLLQQIQQDYLQQAAVLWQQACGLEKPTTQEQGAFKDKRFATTAWQTHPWAHFSVLAYQLHAKTLMDLVQAVQSDAKTKARILFLVEQWLAAAAPSNCLAMNPEVQEKALQTQGASLAQGLNNLLQDLQRGHVSMTDESVFEVGKNVAVSPGAVVFENEFFQLLEYQPLTDKVYAKPLLLVPPCINKFYILDLQPENSFIRYAVAQGHRTFVVSWRNADASMQEKTWDDYVEHGVIAAITVTREITKAPDINTLGFCVGGTLLSTALAVLAARGQDPVASLTLLTVLLDFTHTGILDVFIDENAVQYREKQMGQSGLLKGQELATTFNFLRPNDLVWNYVVNNYLKGQTPPPFDLLYWNSDATNMPGPFYAWYLRNTYHENNLIKPGKLTLGKVKLDLRKIKLPVYVYGSREDHIVPIEGAYASTQVLRGKKRFVMGASGHIAGVINPASKNKRSYWTCGTPPSLDADFKQWPASFEAWLENAQEHPGSWWSDWSAWVQLHAGEEVAAPKTYGSRKYKPIEPAPGRYVKVKA